MANYTISNDKGLIIKAMPIGICLINLQDHLELMRHGAEEDIHIWRED